jgi:plastocyanin
LVNELDRALVYTVINFCHLAISVAAGLALLLTSCGDTSTAGSTTGSTSGSTRGGTAPSASSGSSTTGGATDEVVVQGYAFPPITATAGSSLTLVNRDLEPHTVTADDGSFDSHPFTMKKPATLVVPTAPGSYAFHCKVHPTMHGTLVVH